MKRRVEINEIGYRVGASHPNAKLTNEQVEQLIDDRGPGHAPLMSLQQLADKWEMSKSGVKGIIDGNRRCQLSTWKEIDA